MENREIFTTQVSRWSEKSNLEKFVTLVKYFDQNWNSWSTVEIIKKNYILRFKIDIFIWKIKS